jgi:hypothetical protein
MLSIAAHGVAERSSTRDPKGRLACSLVLVGHHLVWVVTGCEQGV